MRVILFGASGMIGSGVLASCLGDPRVERVLSVARSPLTVKHDKLEELLHTDFFDYRDVEDRFRGFDACFFCLGVSAAGMSEDDYARLTHDLTLRAAEALLRVAPEMVFCYVSGAGTDATERGQSMWARVKGKTENDLAKLPFRATFMFRPGLVRPMKGVKSKTKLYRVAYGALAPVFPLLGAIAPNAFSTSEQVGVAMIDAAAGVEAPPVLEVRDINALAARAAD